MKDLSVIIVNYRSWDKLTRCLDALAAIRANYFSFEVIVVDNSLQVGKLNELRGIFPQYTFLLNSGNYGFASGNNLGAANSNGKYLLFLNPDTLISERALLAMLDQVKVSRANSIISCRLLMANGTENKSYGVFPSPLSLTRWTRAVAKVFNLIPEPRQNDRFIFPDWVSGSVMMMSKTSFNTVGKWNERFWMYYEDVDLCRRSADLGGAVILLKNIALVHDHNASSGSDAEITSLTKTEALISEHEYISLHEDGLKEVLMHTFIILNNLVSRLVSAIPGLILFSNRRCVIANKVFVRLLIYYFNAFIHDTWISPRSLKHPESYQFRIQADKNLSAIRDENS